MSSRQLAALIAWVVIGWGGGARADPVLVHFHGAHPVDPGLGRAMCRIDGPHLHAYAPHTPLLYVKVGPSWSFIGDPTEFEAAAPRYAYYGHHPVFWIDGPADHYCYITGPHHHAYGPNPTLEFKLKGGVHWYVGAHPSWYKQRLARHRQIDRHYASVQIVRPVVHVSPPAGFIGVMVGPGGVVAGAAIRPPSVRVNIPIPSVGIVVGGGGPVVHHQHYHGGKVKYRKVKHRKVKYRKVKHHKGKKGRW